MLLEWVTGRWYLAVTCHRCGWQFAFQRDSDKFDPVWVISEIEFVLTCPDCRSSQPYRAKDIRTVQAK